MKLKVFTATAVSVLAAALASPAVAQEAPSGGEPRSGQGTPPAEQPAADAPASAPPAAPETSSAPPAAAPVNDTPVRENAAIDVSVSAEANSTEAPGQDDAPTKIGEKLSPLILTTGLGYAYAAVTHPDLVSHSLSGAFLEIAVGTELDQRFRLSLSFTSFETKIRRVRGGWEEGDFTRIAAAGLHSTKDPIEPFVGADGGVEVQKTFHAHSVGPRIDFFPLGSKGPYLGMTTALGIIQDVGTRVGADLGARVGGEWRPFQALSFSVEAGAHGQIYGDATAAIPYTIARLTFLLQPDSVVSGRRRAPTTPVPMQRTLPQPMPR